MPAVLREPASGEVFQLEDFTLIGRSEGVTVRLGDSSISRQHATIRREGVNYWLVDLGSANGSYVNDVALTSARMLQPRRPHPVRQLGADFPAGRARPVA